MACPHARPQPHRIPDRRRAPGRSLLMGATAALALALAAPAANAQRGPEQAPPQQQQREAATTGMQHGERPVSFSQLAKAKLPAVVTITASGEAQAGPGGIPGGPASPFPPGSPFEDFFEDFFGQPPGGPGGGAPGAPGQPPQSRPTRSLGSGFIIDPSGFIVTNNHVVEGATEVQVTLESGRTIQAEVVGTDPATDIALLRVDAGEELPALAWGDSDAAEVGDWIIAIGNPFGLGGSVTAGIISARARDIGAGNYDDFIQTDAAINSGNSGGPMIDMDGRVIGVNTAIFSRTGGSVGIGFSVPSAIASSVVAELREQGFVTRGFLGVTIQPVTEEIAEALGLQAQEGALVSSVSPDSPAARAGLQTGDVVVSVNGETVEEPRDLSRRVADIDPGERVQLEVLREGERQTIQAQVGELPREQQTAEAAPQDQGSPLGLALAPAGSPEVRQQFGLPDDATGAVVVGVQPGSPAAERGFQPGDLITRANRQPVQGPEDLTQAIQQARKDGRDSLVVLRQTEQGAVFVPLPLSPDQG